MYVPSICKRAWYCYRYENPDITAWLKCTSARGPTTVIVAIYSSSALLFLARRLPTCDGKEVDLGLPKPLKLSSVLALASTMENIINVILTPYWGALADAKSNRKALLIFANLGWVSAIGVGAILLFFKPSLAIIWLFIVSLLGVAVFYELALVLAFAYLPEIVSSKTELTAVVSRQYAIVNVLQLLGAGIMLVLSFPLEDVVRDDRTLTIIAHGIVIVNFVYFGIPGLRYIPSRKRLMQEKKIKSGANAEEEQVLVTVDPDGPKAGPLAQLWHTVKEVWKSYPTVKWFLLAWSFYFAGVAQVTVLTVAYVTQELNYGTAETGYIGAVLLVFGVFGALLAEYLSKHFRLKNLLFCTVVLWIVGILLAPWLLRGEEIGGGGNVTIGETGCDESTEEVIVREPTALANLMVWVFAAIFGLGIGFVYPTNVAIYSLIIPGGDEASYFGLKAFCSKIISWAPPLLFLAINEGTGNLQIAFGSLAIWFIISLPFLYMMDVDQGIVDVRHTLHRRQGVGKNIEVDGYIGERREGEVEPEGEVKVDAKEAAELETKAMYANNPVFNAMTSEAGIEEKMKEVEEARMDALEISSSESQTPEGELAPISDIPEKAGGNKDLKEVDPYEHSI